MKKIILAKIMSIVVAVVITASCQSPASKENSETKPYRLEFTVKGWKDTTAYLAHYFGELTYLKDTAKVDTKGHFVFDGKGLQQGIYIIVLNKNKVFDFVVGKTTKFSMETDTTNIVGNMVVKGDEDNKVFFENLAYNSKHHKEAEPFIKVLKDSLASMDAKKAARTEYDKIGETVMDYQKELVKKYPDLLTSRLLKSGQPIKVPEPPKLPNGKIDSTFQLRYYREHFFDNFDLTDDALIRTTTPEYRNKIHEYLDRLYLQTPDSVMKGVDKVVALAKPNKETYKYATFVCLSHYQQPEFMGLDATYIKIYDKYVGSGEMDYWLKKDVKKNMKEFADKLRLAQIGKTAPDLMMQDGKLQPKKLYDMKAKYVALLFFDHNCGHCRTEAPHLVESYNRSHTLLNYDVFAVDIDTTLAKMREFEKEFKTPWTTVNGPRTYYKDHSSKLYQHDTTPFMYVIEMKTKKIIARKLPVEQLEDFLSRVQNIKLPFEVKKPDVKKSKQ